MKKLICLLLALMMLTSVVSAATIITDEFGNATIVPDEDPGFNVAPNNPTPSNPDIDYAPMNPAPSQPTSSKPQLNKKDHFAFMEGYPNGTFGPDKGMTRAEVAAMFSRLMVKKMDVNKTYPCSFNDVYETDWYANYIGYLEQFQVMTGDPDGSFRPNDPITRAEFAAVACRFDDLTKGDAMFSDVTEAHWAYDYINFAAAKGWITGYPDGTFKPEKNISRCEVVTVTCRLLERSADHNYVKAHYDELPRTFKDVPDEDSHWAFWAIMEAANGHDYEKHAAEETWTAVYE